MLTFNYQKNYFNYFLSLLVLVSMLMSLLAFLNVKNIMSGLAEFDAATITTPQFNPYFVENAGQAPQEILYYLEEAGSHSVYFYSDKVVFQNLDGTFFQSFIGNNPSVNVVSREKLETTLNYIKGDNHIYNISTYSEIWYKEVYPGIDVKYYFNKGTLEFDAIVAPRADPSIIKIGFEGVDNIFVDAAGKLTVIKNNKEFIYDVPYVFQESDSGRVEIDGKFIIQNDDVGFEIGEYDSSLPLMIDPTFDTLQYSTLVGTSGYDSFNFVRLDSDYVYLVGETKSNSFPIVGATPYDSTFNDASNPVEKDIVIVKMNKSLSSIVASTYIGGGADDIVSDLELDASGNLLVCGQTESGNGTGDPFPTTGSAYDSDRAGGQFDAFFFKMDPSLSGSGSLLISTYFGANGNDSFNNIILKSGDTDIWIIGHGDVPSGPSVMQAATNQDGYGLNLDTDCGYDCSGNAPIYVDGFALRFNSTVTDIEKFTFLGGGATDYLTRAIYDSTENAIYMGGLTYSNNFPTTTGAYDETFPGSETYHAVFISKMDTDLTTLSASTYLWEPPAGEDPSLTGSNYVNSIAKDGSSLFVFGSTAFSGFPYTSGAYDEVKNGGYDVYISKFNASLTTLSASTFLGGSGVGNAMEIYDSNLYFVGQATSSYPLTAGAYNSTHGGSYYENFLSKMDYTLGTSSLLGSTLLPETYSTDLNAYPPDLEVDTDGDVYVAGAVSDANYEATSGAYDETHNGGYDGFVAVMNTSVDAPEFSTYIYLATLFICLMFILNNFGKKKAEA